MLSSILIQNIVLIEKLQLEFKLGFCALTGETGAGKSILLDSLGLALGMRAESGLIRKGAEQASVTAVFEVENDHPAVSLLREQGVESGTQLILRRILKQDGPSRAFINDQPVSAGLLRQVGDTLLEIHGQFETQGLLDPASHRAMLDEYAGVDTAGLSKAWETWQTDKLAVIRAKEQAQRAREEEEYLRKAVADLEMLTPQKGEEETLSSQRQTLMRRDQIIKGLQSGKSGLNTALSHFYNAWRDLEKAGEETLEICAALEKADAEMQDALLGIQSLSADLRDGESNLTQIDDRLFALRAQARKHHCIIDELPAVLEGLKAQLSALEREEELVRELAEKAEMSRRAYVDMAKGVSQIRKETGARLDKLVGEELPPLKLEKARFVTAVEDLPEEEWGTFGMNRVRFTVSTNPGREPGALHKIASGGELSRFMLALKVVMASVGSASSLIFDEVDAGIGGGTAAAVGERLGRLSKGKQILVVTHAPQVAARADHHYIVSKDGAETVRTTVVPLSEMDQRREEIARMLAGAEITDEARAAAGKLLATGT